MNLLDIRITARSESGTCQLTQKKRTEVFSGEFPLGTPSMTLCADALLQEIRRTMIHQAAESETPVSADDAASRRPAGRSARTSEAA